MSDIMTVSSRFQVVIPKSVRERTDIRVGDKLVPLVKGNHITLVKLRPIEELYGIAAGYKMGPIEDEEDRY